MFTNWKTTYIAVHIVLIINTKFHFSTITLLIHVYLLYILLLIIVYTQSFIEKESPILCFHLSNTIFDFSLEKLKYGSEYEWNI